MKKLLFISLIFAVFTVLDAGNALKEKPKSCKDDAKAAENKKSAEDFQKYQKNAEKNNDMTLAEACKKCAEAKLKIAKGYETGDRNMIETGNYELKKALFERDEASQGEYLSQAKEAEAKGNKALADICRKLAEAKLKMVKARKTGDKKGQDAASAEFRKAWASREKLTADDLAKQAAAAEKAGKTELADALKKCVDSKTKVVKAYEANDSKAIDEAAEEYKKVLAEKDAIAKAKKGPEAK